LDIAFSLKDARRARAEKQGEPKHFEHTDGKVYDLPVELPFTFSEALLEAKWREAVAILLNGQAESFFAVEPALTNEDLQAFAEGISEVYVGGTPGESPASRSRSTNTGQSSRPRSKRSTTKT
jgi:hypothetical protein